MVERFPCPRCGKEMKILNMNRKVGKLQFEELRKTFEVFAEAFSQKGSKEAK